MDELNPITRQEKIIAGEDIQPVTRMEKLLAGEDLEPVTRLEHFVKKYKSGTGGGSTGGVEHSDYINPNWTDWKHFSEKNNRNSLVSKLKFNDTSNGKNFGSMFYYCSTLTTIPRLDTSNGTDFSYMFCRCSQLTTIPRLDTSNGKDFSSMFYDCTELQNVTFVGNFPVEENLAVFDTCPKLTVDSLMSFINALSDNTGISTTYKITIGSRNLAKLTADQIQIATDKNITLA